MISCIGLQVILGSLSCIRYVYMGYAYYSHQQMICQLQVKLVSAETNIELQKFDMDELGAFI